MTTSETLNEKVARYEAGGVQDPASTDERGKFWWNLLQADPAERLRVIARCAEAGWVDPSVVGYLATVIGLPGDTPWDDIVRECRRLYALANPPAPEPPDPGPVVPPARFEGMIP